jgi:hypothetical protein
MGTPAHDALMVAKAVGCGSRRGNAALDEKQ